MSSVPNKFQILKMGEQRLKSDNTPAYISKIVLATFSYFPEFLVVFMYRMYQKYSLYRRIKSVNSRVSSYDISKIPLFKSIEIETVNRCNGTCPFCPVNINEKQRPYAKMDSNLFYKIINELSDLHYSGELALFSNNEPFLDNRMVDFCKYAKEHVPNAYLYLYTNGSVLSLEKFLQSIHYLDYLIIDNYNDDMVLNDPVRIISNYCEGHPELLKKVKISLRLQNEILTSRGGQAPNKPDTRTMGDVKCRLPFEQLVIRPDGKVSLCCNDALGKYTLGDVSVDTLKSVWYSEAYSHVRLEIMNNGRKKLYLCRECDTVM